MSIVKKFFVRSLVMLAAVLSLSSMAHASLVYSTTLALTAADPSTLGRISRSGVPSDWSAPKVFPGVINPSTTYHYHTVTLDLAALEAGFVYGQYFQITIDSLSANTFLAAYLNSYNPGNKALNYLGDAGSSGNSFGGTDPLVFQVQAGITDDIVLMFTDTLGGALVTDSANILVEAFADNMFTDLQAVPEPSSVALMLLCLAVLVAVARRNGIKIGAAPAGI